MENEDIKYINSGILSFIGQDLDEKVEMHDTLNPKIWDTNNELLEEVEEKLRAIVKEFERQLLEDNIDINIKDIYILGSNANYNYRDTSDLDLHIIADDNIDCTKNHLQIIYNAYKALFNNKYDITIRGINVEVYVENMNKLNNVSTGIYSLNKGWIKDPTQNLIPEIDEDKFEETVAKWEEKYIEIQQSPTLKSIDDYIDSLYKLRIESIKKDGEFGFNNLIFKEIRHLGYLNNLKQLRIHLKNKELSLE